MILSNFPQKRFAQTCKNQIVPVYQVNDFSARKSGTPNLAKLSATLLREQNALLITSKTMLVRSAFQFFINPPDILLLENITASFPPHPHNNGRLLVTEVPKPQQISLSDVKRLVNDLDQNHVKIEWIVVTDHFSADLFCWHLKL